jgi:hypothetical protein
MQQESRWNYLLSRPETLASVEESTKEEIGSSQAQPMVMLPASVGRPVWVPTFMQSRGGIDEDVGGA